MASVFTVSATWLPLFWLRCVFIVCLSFPCNINISLSRGNNRNIQKEKIMEVSASRKVKILMRLQVNDSKSEREDENVGYKESEQGEEGKTSLVKLGSEGAWAHNQWSEVCVCCICGVESASQKPILFLQGRQVCCYALWEGLPQLGKRHRTSTQGLYHTSRVDRRKMGSQSEGGSLR